MRFSKAFITALKFHLLAFVPTLLGLGIAAAGIWFGVGQPLLELFRSGAPISPDILPQIVQAINAPIAIAAILLGWLVRRVGRTTMLFWTHGRAVSSRIDQVVEEEVAAGSAETSSATSAATTGATSAETDTGSSNVESTAGAAGAESRGAAGANGGATANTEPTAASNDEPSAASNDEPSAEAESDPLGGSSEREPADSAEVETQDDLFEEFDDSGEAESGEGGDGADAADPETSSDEYDPLGYASEDGDEQ